jgi:hypothetical protein
MINLRLSMKSENRVLIGFHIRGDSIHPQKQKPAGFKANLAAGGLETVW